jgi:hypothetical protein
MKMFKVKVVVKHYMDVELNKRVFMGDEMVVTSARAKKLYDLGLIDKRMEEVVEEKPVTKKASVKKGKK